ncbi:cryptochrome/photolyase family protein [Actibacterium ureilyticum]|uniref:cryptochrome/photolyase family protein n=1 Tax=Actibacterium ureilyticum TaxID=1590614 RepID=UPI000BAA9CE0|nr:deoxyribodipyrimidine photo-lyase [Actibacterium ureilyticum]
MSTKPVILWLRRDLRLGDHPALSAAVATGQPVIPLFIHDDQVADMGAAPRFRLGAALDRFGAALSGVGSRLILRRGPAQECLNDLIKETGADKVFWSRSYDPASIDRDSTIKTALKDQGVTAQSFAGFVLFEPWTVETKQGGFYQVYSPFWRAVRDRDPGDPLPAPDALKAPESWPASDDLDDWDLSADMRRGADVLKPHMQVGEGAAQDRLRAFLDGPVDGYRDDRDFPARPATSGLSENLTYGEISPRAIWHAGQRAKADGAAGAEHFLKELVWRDFAWHLAYHTPRIFTDNWRDGWDGFPWKTDEDRPEVLAWKQGRTGVPFVDAAMRELYVTGTMHNRARMIVASYLTKHLLADWRIGQRWFADCLIDWDPASNAMGWQWVAGSGPDAAPYFRIFNPETQADKFDPKGTYRDRWIAEGRQTPTDTALSYFDAIPQSWDLSPKDAYPDPVVALSKGREGALAAYERYKSTG